MVPVPHATQTVKIEPKREPNPVMAKTVTLPTSLQISPTTVKGTFNWRTLAIRNKTNMIREII